MCACQMSNICVHNLCKCLLCKICIQCVVVYLWVVVRYIIARFSDRVPSMNASVFSQDASAIGQFCHLMRNIQVRTNLCSKILSIVVSLNCGIAKTSSSESESTNWSLWSKGLISYLRVVVDCSVVANSCNAA